jgi:hypothetical protein
MSSAVNPRAASPAFAKAWGKQTGAIMRRTLIPFAVVAALTSLELSATVLIDDDDLAYIEEPAYDPLAEEYARREAEIAAEIIEGSIAPWAGEYHLGDGLAANVRLVMAPDRGFAAIWTGCMGVYGRSFGSVTQQGDRLLLNHEVPNQPGMFGNFSNVLVPVHMGKQAYLVGEEQMGEFVHAMNTGAEACPDFCGLYLIRSGDWDLMDSPGDPLHVRVTRVIEPDQEAVDGDFRWRKATVELDAGRDGGIRQGMEFYSSTAGWITDTITVVKVDDTSAVATVSAYDRLPIPVRAGTCVSTYFDDAIEKRVYGQPQRGCEDGVVAGR